MPPVNAIMLGYEGTTTIYEESSGEKDGGGGTLGSAGSSSDGFGEEVTVYAGSSGGASSSSSSSSGVDITASPADAAEEALERRLAEGYGTPEEALAFFQRYGHPELSTLPTWDSSIRKWVFPQAASSGDGNSSGSVGFVTSGSSNAGSGSASSPGANTGSSGQGDSANGGGAAVNPHGSWTAIDGPDLGVNGQGSGNSGPTGTQSGTDGPPHDNLNASTGLVDPIGNTDGYKGGPAIVDPDNGGDDDANGGDNDAGVDQNAGGYGSEDAEGFEGLKAPDGSPLVPYQIHFADRQMDGLFRDILDENNPLLARMALGYLIVPASIGVLVERHFVNAMLAAPAHLYGALALEKAAADAFAKGNVAGGIADHYAATKHFRETALAIATILPFGSEAKAAQKGVVYGGMRFIDTTMPEWARAQSWVTKSIFEYRFLVGDQTIMVDGILSKTGETFAQNPKAIILVEVKTNGAIAWALRDANKMADLVWQLDMYVGLAQRLEVGGVRYVIVEATEGAPMMQAMRNIVAQRYGSLLESGFIEVIFERPPPASWKGPKLVPEKWLPE